MNDFKAYLAELVGTYTLIFVGAGAICIDALTDGEVGLVGIALAHGLAIAIMVSATGPTSGGHLNPAVTIGALAGGKISFKNSILYIIAQVLGAVLASLSHKVIFNPEILEAVHYGTPALDFDLSLGTGIFIEAILTFFLVFTVYGTAFDERAPRVGGLFIGLAITMGILAGGPLTGAAMNPARAFGPALLSGYWINQLVYWVGPAIGGFLAAIVYQYMLGGFWAKK
jgi:MIP family channel proteins